MKTESYLSKIRDKTRISTLITLNQRVLAKQLGNEKKSHPNWKRSKIVAICRWKDFIYRKKNLLKKSNNSEYRKLYNAKSQFQNQLFLSTNSELVKKKEIKKTILFRITWKRIIHFGLLKFLSIMYSIYKYCTSLVKFIPNNFLLLFRRVSFLFLYSKLLCVCVCI